MGQQNVHCEVYSVYIESFATFVAVLCCGILRGVCTFPGRDGEASRGAAERPSFLEV